MYPHSNIKTSRLKFPKSSITQSTNHSISLRNEIFPISPRLLNNLSPKEHKKYLSISVPYFTARNEKCSIPYLMQTAQNPKSPPVPVSTSRIPIVTVPGSSIKPTPRILKNAFVTRREIIPLFGLRNFSSPAAINRFSLRRDNPSPFHQLSRIQEPMINRNAWPAFVPPVLFFTPLPASRHFSSPATSALSLL